MAKKVSILPPHPLRPDYNRHFQRGNVHDLFQRRLEPQNYTREFFGDLAERLREELSRDPRNDALRYELAFVILQNRANMAAVSEAQSLLSKITTESVRRAADVIRLRELVAGILKRRQEVTRQKYSVPRVNWSINNRCPMSCRGCYNPFAETQIDFDQAQMIVDKLARHGTSELVISGGDPLLWDPIYDTVDYARSVGLHVAVDTTGYTMTANSVARLRESVSSLRLPLDGSTAEVQRAFRRSSDPDLVGRLQKSLFLCDELDFHRVRVHTVASKQNLDDLPNVADAVFEHACVQQWVVFQWWGRRATRALTEEMLTSADAIENRLDRIRQSHPSREIIFAEASDREFLNFMIQSSGQVVTFASGLAEEFIVGNLLDDEMDEILASPILDFEAMGRGVSVRLNSQP
ncbi:radical SAM protein [Streptomyces sp. NPDC001127]|uniref:radical SAM protein n=1 Tax=Streptomyces sp. NPDC001127 TaxID=3154377 RepID=UPI00332D51E8